MTQVNGVPNSNNAGWNRQLANQLDEMDGKKDSKISDSVFGKEREGFIRLANELLEQNANSTPTQEKIQKVRDALNQIKNGSNTIPVSPETQAILKNLDLEKIMEELEEKKGESYVI